MVIFVAQSYNKETGWYIFVQQCSFTLKCCLLTSMQSLGCVFLSIQLEEYAMSWIYVTPHMPYVAGVSTVNHKKLRLRICRSHHCGLVPPSRIWCNVFGLHNQWGERCTSMYDIAMRVMLIGNNKLSSVLESHLRYFQINLI